MTTRFVNKMITLLKNATQTESVKNEIKRLENLIN